MSVPGHSEEAVLLRSATFAYAKGPAVLEIDELRIAGGESVFLHGPSGSGKSTLLSLISGILQPKSGVVQVLGQDLTRLSPSACDTLRGSRMGYIFQGFNLIPYLSVAQQQRVAIARAIIGSPELLIADEPTSSLDTDRRDAFLNLLTEVTGEARARGAHTTLLFVSHDRGLATHFDRTLSLQSINRAAPLRGAAE